MTDATVIPIAEAQFRERVKVRGRVRSLRVRPWADSPTLEVVLVDETGGITVVFLARRRIGGTGVIAWRQPVDIDRPRRAPRAGQVGEARADVERDGKGVLAHASLSSSSNL